MDYYRRRKEIELIENSRYIDEDFYRIEHYYNKDINYRMINKELPIPKWFIEDIEKINIHFIETQRIITLEKKGGDSYSNTVNNCSKELREQISNVVKKAADVTSSLDSTYPNRLITKLKQGATNTFAELNEALLKLDEKRKLYSSAGLVVDTQDKDILQINDEQEHLINLLKLYIDDSHKKLEPYDKLSKRIILFLGIVNRRFKHKKLEINKEDGFVFKSTVLKDEKDNFLTIPLSKLSSGEQHELILFYKLIFNTKSGDTILIDEPELSLHISWQNKFISDLKDVTSINDLTFIIATHSPDIIDINWELRVELTGLE